MPSFTHSTCRSSLLVALFCCLIPAREEPYLAFVQKRLIRLGYPYFLWASLQTLLQCLLSRYTNHTLGFGAFLRLGIEPPMQF